MVLSAATMNVFALGLGRLLAKTELFAVTRTFSENVMMTRLPHRSNVQEPPLVLVGCRVAVPLVGARNVSSLAT